MPWQSVRLAPGLDTEQTPSLLEGRFTTASLVRWREGLVEKLGGWTAFYPNVMDSTVRELHAWESLNNVKYLAVGSSQSLEAISGSDVVTLTPQTFSSTIAPNFSTGLGSKTVTIVDSNISNVTTFDTINLQIPVAVGGLVLYGPYQIQSIVSATSYIITAASNAGANVVSGGSVPSLTTTNNSAYVTVTLTAHGLTAGATLNFPVAVTIGGLTIQGNYQVSSVTDANNVVISASAAATSGAGPTAMNSGNVAIIYNIGIGPQQGGGGYGTGGWGTGGWGTGTTIAQQTGTPVTPTDWTLDHWGEDLLGCPKGGTIWYWSPESGTQTMIPVPNAPPYNNGIMVVMPQLILMAWGSTSQLSLGQAQDPLLVSWCNPGDFTNWSITNATLAGDFRLSGGSTIVGGFQASFRTLLFTDTDCWAADYTGYPYAFSFNIIGRNCGLIARKAVAELQGRVFWMSSGNFYTMASGMVRALPCPVYDAVFQDLDMANAWKIKAGVTASFNEIWWFYPSLSGGTGENDKYVKYNVVENAWDYGTLPRSAWLGDSIFGPPIGAGSTDYMLYQHEIGYDANNAAMVPSWSTGWISLQEGEEFPFIDQLVPDLRWTTFNGAQQASAQFTLQSVTWPGETPTTYGPYTVTQDTTFIPLRIRDRFVSLSMSSSDSSTFWRMGRPRFRIAPSGRQ